MNKRWIAAFSLLLMVGCGSNAHPDPRHEALDSAPSVDLQAMTQTPSGLYIVDFEVGSGEGAVPGHLVTVYYTGWFRDGDKFDSSVDRGETYSFPLGEGRVISGWDEGVAGMKVGGWRRLVIPPELAYGPEGGRGIPPNSTLVFDVELLAVE